MALCACHLHDFLNRQRHDRIGGAEGDGLGSAGETEMLKVPSGWLVVRMTTCSVDESSAAGIIGPFSRNIAATDVAGSVLAFVRWPAMDRLRSLMDRVKMVDLTPQEILALVAVFESADCPRSRTPHPGLK
jgi:hypothetical protein